MHFPTLVSKRLEHIRNARRSRAEIDALQLRKFRRLVRHAVAHSPYYRDLVDARRIDVDTCCVEDFPPLTKGDLIANLDRILTVPAITRTAITEFLERSHDSFELFQGEYYVVNSSGTSGMPGYIAFSRRDWARGIAHALRVNPPSLGRRRVAYFARTKGHAVGVSFATSTKRWPLSLIYDVALFDLNERLANVIEGLNRFRPTILMGYPSALTALAGEQRRGALRVQPKWVQSSGEPVTPGDRALIESTFGAPFTNVYSCTEHMLMGFSRSEFEGMYLFEDDLIFEMAADHTLVTNLFNFTTPLIRYHMNDTLVPVADSVRALPFTKIAEIVGRGEMGVHFTNAHGVDDVIQPSAVAVLHAKNVRGFQVYVTGKTSCALRVCLDHGLDEDARRAALSTIHAGFRDLLATKEMGNVALALEEVTEFPRDERSGKFRIVAYAPGVQRT